MDVNFRFIFRFAQLMVVLLGDEASTELHQLIGQKFSVGSF